MTSKKDVPSFPFRALLYIITAISSSSQREQLDCNHPDLAQAGVDDMMGKVVMDQAAALEHCSLHAPLVKRLVEMSEVQAGGEAS